MLLRLADLAHLRARRVLLVTALAFVVAAVFGGPVAGLLSTDNGFTDPGSESVVAADRIERLAKDDPAPRAVLLVSAGRDVRDRAVRDRVVDLAAEAGTIEGVARAATFHQTKDPALLSRDGRSTYIPIWFSSRADGSDVGEAVRARFEGRPGVLVGGPAVAEPAIGDQVSKDLARAELLAFPLLFLLSLWVFRGVVAALLPLFVGVLTIFGTFLTLRLVHGVVDLSIFALNLAIALGLGLAIDYSLFIVSRYREELERHGRAGADQALRATLASAGRTVLFSAVTVAAALASLLVFPQKFLYSMGVAGLAGALIAGLVSVTALPALLALLGGRVNALAPERWRHQPTQGLWYRLSRWVMRRAIPVATISAALLVLLGLPALGIKFTGVDASALDTSSPLRQVEEALRTEFPPPPTAPVTVVVDAPPSAVERVRAYADSLRGLDGVAAVRPPSRLGGSAWTIELVPEGRPFEERSQDVVHAVRDRDGPLPVQVAGESAEFVDQQASLGARLPLALALLCGTTLVVLFLMTGSLVLPVKALVMNLLTLSGAFGLLVLVFQDGRLEGLLDYTSQGALEATQPVVLFAVAFALSTDYGVFLLTRIKEAHDSGLASDEAVAVGLERTGRIVTAAALLLSVALGAFATSQVIFIKQVGLGTVFAVLIDATIVRAFLVPSLMKLLGEWNWWAPRPLRRLHGRLGVVDA
jgi:RND superfamily putative drug exporter